ncbi:MAG: 5'-nucleotidase C-terminal domain-containing protein [Prevotella sp.]|nr:5'-nucleotidase C-terminal domain-containing protein [Prevotella sp.]
MRNKHLTLAFVMLTALLSACATHYHVTGISRTRCLIDDSYDKHVPQHVADFMQPYKQQVDQIFSPVIGKAKKDLVPDMAESTLGNLMADIMVWAAKDYGELPDFGVYNRGGLRASIAKGDITIGDATAVAPFENRICFLTLSGNKVLELMQQIVNRGGHPVSKEVKIFATKDNQLKRVTIKGKDVDPKASYRVVTVDYVAHGNDQMVAFKDGTLKREFTGEEDLTRSLLIKYVKEMTAQGKVVDSEVEGRYTIVEE